MTGFGLEQDTRRYSASATPERGLGHDEPSPRPAVSFVVIAFNEADKIANTLTSILAQQTPAMIEVIVVDDGSADGTDAIVERMAVADRRIRLLRQGRNTGRGAARQAGVAAAQGQHVAFVDADVILGDSWLQTCQAALEHFDAVAGTAVPDGDVAFCHRAFALRPKAVPHTVTVTGSNSLFRRRVFDEVALDPDLRNGEDVKLDQDMMRSGLRTHRVPGLTVSHQETKTYTESLAWLWESGVGASRQLVREREVRFPDLVSTAFLGTAAYGLALWGAQRDARLFAAACGMLPVIAAGHLTTRFRLGETPRRSPLAIAAHTPLIGAYMAGRVAGYFPRRAADPR